VNTKAAPERNEKLLILTKYKFRFYFKTRR